MLLTLYSEALWPGLYFIANHYFFASGKVMPCSPLNWTLGYQYLKTINQIYKIRKFLYWNRILPYKYSLLLFIQRIVKIPKNLHVCHSEIYCQSKVSLKIATKVIQKEKSINFSLVISFMFHFLIFLKTVKFPSRFLR